MTDQKLTSREKGTLNLLADAWILFIGDDEPIDHDGAADFRKAIHDAQRIVAMEIATRVEPEFWKRQ